MGESESCASMRQDKTKSIVSLPVSYDILAAYKAKAAREDMDCNELMEMDLRKAIKGGQ